MFNSTHTLVGYAIARTGLDEWVPYAAATAVIAANLPDIEILTGLSGTATYLDHHRGITHSLIGIPVLALLLAGGMYFFSGKFWKTFAVALLAMATHPMLDYTNTYGLRPFLPFDSTWYYGDLLFIFDPYIDAILLGGILTAGVLNGGRKAAAWISLILAVTYIGARVELRTLAASEMEEYVAKIPGAKEWAVFPTMINPLVWEGIIGTKTQWIKVNVHATEGVQDEVARMDRGTFSDVVMHAASESESAAALLRFARFPAFHAESKQSGYRVLLLDFRFYDNNDKTALGAEVQMDRSMHVTREELSFGEIAK